jgi:hypothetical protein
MTDAELIEALRNVYVGDSIRLTAANRIEQAGAVSNSYIEIQGILEITEDKLAKATEALQAFENFDDMPLSAKRPDIFERMVRQPILAALAEIKGE